MRSLRVLCLCLVIGGAIGLAAGCGTVRGAYAYRPAPAASGAATPRVLASVAGVLRGGEEPAGIDVRLRLEAGTGTAELDIDAISLVTADLTSLELASVDPAVALVVAAGEAATFRLVFAFPAGHDHGDFDLEGLVLSYTLLADGAPRQGDLRFVRVPPPGTEVPPLGWYDPWHRPFRRGPHGPWHSGPWHSGW